MSKEIDWGLVHGEGTINCICDNCGVVEDIDFDDGPDFREAQDTIQDKGWVSTKIKGQWFDFCCEDCRNQYIREHT